MLSLSSFSHVQTEEKNLDYQLIFETTPGLYLILEPTPPDFKIVSVNKAYLEATMTKKEEIIGRGIFEVFTDDPSNKYATGPSNLKNSLERVITDKKPDIMAIQRYDFRNPASAESKFEGRYWSPINIPVFNSQQKIEAIIHRVEDVTNFIQYHKNWLESGKNLDELLGAHISRMAAEIFSKEGEKLRTMKENQEKVKTLELGINNIRDYAIFCLDTEGHVTSWNNGAEIIKGYKADEILGQSFIKFYKPEAVTEHHPEKILEIAKKQGHFEEEDWRVRKDGTSFWANIIITPIYNDMGKHLGYIKITRDLTERKLAEEKINALEQMRLETIQQTYEQQLKQKEQFLQSQANLIAEICHEVRNPLQGIYGETEAAKDNVESITGLHIDHSALNNKLTNIRESLDTIFLCADHQRAILDDFIDAAKLDAGRLKIVKLPFNIKQTLLDAAVILRAKAEQKGLELITQLPAEEHWVNGDKSRIKQIAINLLSNAIKFTEEGTITLSLSLLQETTSKIYFSLAVQDTGFGMNTKEKSQLFNQFAQTHESLLHSVESTGLGLYITKKLVELMKGSIQVESEVGKGTTFNCIICCKPLSLEEKLIHQQEQSAQPPASSALMPSRTVLIVDDNIINQKVLKSYLERAGHLCIVKNNGLEAVKSLQEHSWNIIFMDIKMPVMDGLTATRKIRELEKEHQLPHIPIIGLSGNAMESEKEAALEAGMDDYLLKPVKKENVYYSLEKYAFSQVQGNITQLAQESKSQSTMFVH